MQDMQSHVKILGIIHIVFGLVGVCIAFLFLVIFGLGTLGIAGAAAQEDPDALIAVPIVGAIGTAIVLFITVLSLPGILAGWGLLNFKPWARILTIVLSAQSESALSSARSARSGVGMGGRARRRRAPLAGREGIGIRLASQQSERVESPVNRGGFSGESRWL